MSLALLYALFIISFSQPAFALPPAIDGTFIYLGYGSSDLRSDLIPEYFQELKQLNFSTIILGSIQAKSPSSGCNGNTFLWHGDLPYKLDIIMSEASKNNLEVYVGLTETTNECWPPYNESNKSGIWAYLNDTNNSNNPIVYVQNRFGNHPSFKGWYIPDEPGLGWWNDAEIQSSLSYYAGYVSAIRKLSALPILIAPSLAGANGRTPTNFGDMALMFKNYTGISKYVWQDSVGEVGFNVDWRSSPNTKDYYAAVAAKIGNESLWSDIELGNCCVSPTYQWDTGAYNPAPLGRIIAQLNNSPSEYTSKRIVWIQQYQMTSILPLQKQSSARLLSSYKSFFGLGGEYIKPASYAWITPPEAAYPDTNNQELFDLKTGDPQNFLDSRWIDVVNSPTVSIDIGSEKFIKWIGIHLLHQAASGIYFPDSLTFTCSTNNITWTPPRTWNLPVRKADSEYVFSNPNTDPINTMCRHLRITLNKSGWHTFMSEMEIVAGNPPATQDIDQDFDVDFVDYRLSMLRFPFQINLFNIGRLFSLFGK